MHKESIAIVTPRTTEIDLRDIIGSSNDTVVKDVPVLDLLWCGGRCDVTVQLAMDVAIL